MNELDNWYKEISRVKKIKFSEAQELYKKAIDIKDEGKRRDALTMLITGTLYVVYEYIKINNLGVFATSSFDMDDIINAFNEIWVKKIYEGKLLKVSSYSGLINYEFLDDVYDSLGGNKVFIRELFGITVNDFIKYFIMYVKSKKSNSNVLLEQKIYDKYPLQDYHDLDYSDKYSYIK